MGGDHKQTWLYTRCRHQAGIMSLLHPKHALYTVARQVPAEHQIIPLTSEFGNLQVAKLFQGHQFSESIFPGARSLVICTLVSSVFVGSSVDTLSSTRQCEERAAICSLLPVSGFPTLLLSVRDYLSLTSSEVVSPPRTRRSVHTEVLSRL